jgi:hypothetical protein
VLRTRQFEVNHRNSALAAFNHRIAESFEVLPLSGHLRTAARLSDQHLLGVCERATPCTLPLSSRMVQQFARAIAALQKQALPSV